jgi:hypothetical protein
MLEDHGDASEIIKAQRRESRRQQSMVEKNPKRGTIIRPNLRHLSSNLALPHQNPKFRMGENGLLLNSPSGENHLMLDFHEKVLKTPKRSVRGLFPGSTRAKDGHIKIPEVNDDNLLDSEWRLLGGERLRTEDFGFVDNFQGVALCDNDKTYTLPNEDDGEYLLQDGEEYMIPYEELNHVRNKDVM